MEDLWCGQRELSFDGRRDSAETFGHSRTVAVGVRIQRIEHPKLVFTQHQRSDRRMEDAEDVLHAVWVIRIDKCPELEQHLGHMGRVVGIKVESRAGFILSHAGECRSAVSGLAVCPCDVDTLRGLACARGRGRIGGRPFVMIPERVDAAVRTHTVEKKSIARAAKVLGVGASSVSRALAKHANNSASARSL